MLSVLSAGFAPSLAILSYFYLKDEYDTEPIFQVFRVFILGAVLVFPIMFIQYILQVEQLIHHIFIDAFITGLLEEFAKWFFLMFAVYSLVHFDEPYDGIVYGVSLSLGFATLENILFLLSNGIHLAIGRAFFPVSSHAMFGVIMGYYIGKGKFISNKKKKVHLICMALFIPVVLHSLYDFILMSFAKWHYYLIPFMLVLWWVGLKKAKKAKTYYNLSQKIQRVS
jgi:protease PrsW